MEEERSQKELFPFEPPKKRFSGFAEIFRKAGIDGSVFAVTLKIDKLVFISIAIIMLMVVVYALGVERGRKIPPKRIGAAVQQTVPAKEPAEIRPQPSVQVVPAAKEAAVKPYTIAVASLVKRETALREAARMNSNGFEAFVIFKEPYYVVCIGAFADKTSSASLKELARVRHFCKDAYFKQR